MTMDELSNVHGRAWDDIDVSSPESFGLMILLICLPPSTEKITQSRTGWVAIQVQKLIEDSRSNFRCISFSALVLDSVTYATPNP
jgi:hypothetical protein